MMDPDKLEAMLAKSGFYIVRSNRVVIFDRIVEAKKWPR